MLKILLKYSGIIDLPLSALKTGDANRFRITLDKPQRWGIPQNMMYGMVVRVYYKSSFAFQN